MRISGESTTTFVIVGFQYRDKIDSQAHDNRLPILNAVCKIVPEKHPVGGIECDYDRDNYPGAYQKIENVYRLKSETNLLKNEKNIEDKL